MEAGCYMGAYAAMEDFYDFYGLAVVCVLEVFRLLGFTYILIYGKTPFKKDSKKCRCKSSFPPQQCPSRSSPSAGAYKW